MGIFWMLRLGVAVGVLVIGLWSVTSATSTSANEAGSATFLSRVTGLRPDPFLPALGPVSQDDGDNDDGDNDDADNGDADNGESDNDNGDDGDDEDGDDNDNEGDALPFDLPPLPTLVPITSTPQCSTPGEEMAFTSRDLRATLRVFPTMPISLRVTVAPSYDLLALPPTPGRLVGLLIYDVQAAPCGGGAPLAELPAEVNLSLHYDDEDILYPPLDESIIRFAWLDPATNSWQHVEKQALVVERNAMGATITRTGRYIVYEDP